MLLLVLPVVFCLVSAAVEDSPDLQLSRYNNEFKIVSSLLAKECPDYIKQKEEVTDFQKLDLTLKAAHLQYLEQQLLKCRQDKLVSTATSVIDSPVPAECLTATNLTQAWRRDYNGSDIRPGGLHSVDGWACDFYDMGWFRFSGAAGTHMLDTCPKWKSCGAWLPYWTDETPPQAVGVTAKISAYAVYDGNCKHDSQLIQVMRCSLSTDHDLIYKYSGYYFSTCNYAYCGMN